MTDFETKDKKLVEQWIQSYLNDPKRQKVIDKPQEEDRTKPVWKPKLTIHNISGKIIGYWEEDMHYFEDGKKAGFLTPVFLPPLPWEKTWKYDINSGNFYIVPYIV